jgi:hypothetical protein
MHRSAGGCRYPRTPSRPVSPVAHAVNRLFDALQPLECRTVGSRTPLVLVVMVDHERSVFFDPFRLTHSYLPLSKVVPLLISRLGLEKPLSF